MMNEHLDNYGMCALAGSVAEKGPNASQITWNNSKEYSKENTLITTDEEYAYVRRYFKTFGASWTDEELNDKETLHALLTQWIALEIRDLEHLEESEWETESNSGSISGRIYKSDNEYFIRVGE